MSSIPLLFPPKHVKAKEIYADGLKALTASRAEYVRLTKNRSDQFTVRGVNQYNRKRDRLRTLKSNEKLAEEEERALVTLERRITQLSRLDEAQSLLTELNQSKDVNHAVCLQLGKLLDQPGYAIKIRDYLDRTATHEIKTRQAKIDEVYSIIDEINLPQRLDEIARGEQRVADLTSQLSKMQNEIEKNKELYDMLKEQLNRTQVELSERAAISAEEVEGLKNQVAIHAVEKAHSEDKIQRQDRDLDSKDTEIERLQESISNKKAEIGQKASELKQTREQYDKQVKISTDLNRDYQNLLNEKLVNITAKSLHEDRYAAEKQAKENLQFEYKLLQEKYNNLEKQSGRLEEVEIEVEELRKQSKEAELEVTAQKDIVAQRDAQIVGLSSDLNNTKSDHKQCSDRERKLQAQNSEDKLQAQKEIQAVRGSSAIEIATLKTQLDTMATNLKDARDSATKDKATHRSEMREIEENSGHYREQIQEKTGELTALQKEFDTQKIQLSKVTTGLSQLTAEKDGMDKHIQKLQDVIDTYKSGEPIAEQELNAAKEDAGNKQRMYEEMCKKNENIQMQLYNFNELITKYAFGSHIVQQLDYKRIAEVLRACPSVAGYGVQRAIDGLKPVLVGLPTHQPLTGLQLYMEAVVRPDQFTSMKLLAFLENPNPHGFSDIGFLWLTVEALLNIGVAKLKGFRALAVLDILQAWMHIDSSQSEDVSKHLKLYTIKAPVISMSGAPTFDIFIENVHRCLQEIIQPRHSHIPNRGEEMLTNIAAFSNLQSECICMEQPTTGSTGNRTTYSGAFMPLTSEPAYFIYVEDGQVAWLRPEQITVRVDYSQDAIFIHDDQEPHFFLQKRLSLRELDLEHVSEVLKDVTYLD